MQTIVIHAGPAPRPRPERDAARARVESHYRSLWTDPPSCQEAHTETVSMLLWQSSHLPSVWPAWSSGPRTTVASVYVPLGFERLTGSAPLTDAPGVLGRALVASPSRILELGAPFVLAHLDQEADTLDVFTDALGIGRLFEVRTRTGWVWSNRPVAALRYAGLTASRDEEGWNQSAVADGFFGATTPYAGVNAVDAATHLRWDGRAGRRTVGSIDIVASWSEPVSDAPDRERLYDETAEALRVIAGSICRLFPGQPVVDLSGGRDSRLIASAFIATGADVVLHSHDGVPGDLVTARELVARLDAKPEHRINHMPSGSRGAPRRFSAVESTRRWHRYAEGLRPCSFIMHAAPRHLDSSLSAVIGGVGGEIAHGFYYPRDLEVLDALPLHEKLEAFTAAVVGRHTRVQGFSPEARAHLESHVRSALASIAERGVTDARMLDNYYLRDRLRRWGSTAESIGVLSPLLSPSFVRAALALTPADRRGNVLHRGVTRALLPAWADVPYFPSENTRGAASPSQAAPPTRTLRLADCADAGEITGLLADSSFWERPFDVPQVHALWHLSVAGRTTVGQEQTLRRVVWAATFEDHLAAVNEAPPPTRVPAEVPPGTGTARTVRTGPPPKAGGLARLTTTLRRQTAVRRVVRTTAFQRVWHSPLGRGVRTRIPR